MNDVESTKNNPVIRKYLKDVLSWHGYIRFLGMPTLQTSSDVPLDELYVNQSLSLENLSTEKEPTENQLHNPLTLLIKKRHLVILGDPGSGKSTLVNWLAWMLASGFVGRLPSSFDGLIPIPIVLRELNLDAITTFESLIDAFLERPIAKALSGNKQLLLDLFRNNQTLLLVDGLDEVSLEIRTRLQDTFRVFFKEYNESLSIFTSRKVGYEQAPLSIHRNITGATGSINLRELILRTSLHGLYSYSPVECYIAPFTLKQIERFSLNWYRENTTGNNDSAVLLRDEFVSCVKSNESILQLARTPHLLTMMALIFKRRSQLPNGRALLYELIAQAYLESIDTARKLKDPFLWQEKKRWLARVAFEMQIKRHLEKDPGNTGRELLASKEQVLDWIIDAMKESSISDSIDIVTYASLYLDWIARRSGLLLPRGEGQFAFSHLSFQEYFAAVYIQQQIENPEYFEPNSEYESLDLRFIKKPLSEWVERLEWNQVFIFLFELVADKPGWLRRLWRECFDNGKIEKQLAVTDLDYFIFGSNTQDIYLQASLLMNPHVGPYNKSYEEDVRKLVEYSFFEQSMISKLLSYGWTNLLGDHVLGYLLDRPEFFNYVVKRTGSFFKSDGVFLNDINLTSVLRFFKEISEPEQLKNLVLNQCGLQKLDDIANFCNLRCLSLGENLVVNLDGLSRFKNLTYLNLSDNPISSLEEIEALYHLETLVLEGVNVDSYEPLFNLPCLTSLTCSNISEVDFVLQLSELKELIIYDASNLTDISILSKHDNLNTIILSDYVDGGVILGDVERNIEVIYM